MRVRVRVRVRVRGARGVGVRVRGARGVGVRVRVRGAAVRTTRTIRDMELTRSAH